MFKVQAPEELVCLSFDLDHHDISTFIYEYSMNPLLPGDSSRRQAYLKGQGLVRTAPQGFVTVCAKDSALTRKSRVYGFGHTPSRLFFNATSDLERRKAFQVKGDFFSRARGAAALSATAPLKNRFVVSPPLCNTGVLTHISFNLCTDSVTTYIKKMVQHASRTFGDIF